MHLSFQKKRGGLPLGTSYASPVLAAAGSVASALPSAEGSAGLHERQPQIADEEESLINGQAYSSILKTLQHYHSRARLE